MQNVRPVLVAAFIATATIALLWPRSTRAQAPEPVEPPAPLPISGPTEAEPVEEPTREEIETDRDSFTPATRTVGRNRLLLEAAYTFLDNRGVPETHSFPELLLRYGVTERFELRLGWNYEVGGAGNETSSSAGINDAEGARIASESQVLYGFKVRLTNQDRWIPKSIVIVQGFTATSGNVGETALSATYALGWELPNRWKIDAGLRFGTDREESDSFQTWAPSAVLRIPIGERWNLHGEYIGVFSQNRREDFVRHYGSAGVHVLLTPDVELGVRLGWGLNDQSSRFFSNIGFGVQF